MKRSLLLVSCLAFILVVSLVVSAEEGPIQTIEGIKTGPLPEKFDEAPMLADLVEEGKLPPLEERLPEDVMVIEPVEEIGQYGGTMRTAALEALTPCNIREVTKVGLFRFSPDCTKVIPTVAKGYEFSEDYKTITIYLRKGLKWSDGVPFTVDDILFWWEDIALNKEISPTISKIWEPGGEVVEFEKVDDYTLRIHFAVPYPALMTKLGHPWTSGQNSFYLPKHYLKKWHIKYNPDADKLAQEEGYDEWWMALNYHRDDSSWEQDVNLPTLGPWVITRVRPTEKVAERNPYFWQVDTAGNQLPYVDRIVCKMVTDVEALNMGLVSGELDYAGFNLLMENYPLYKENEDDGDYRVLRWRSVWGSAVSCMPNTTHLDPTLREILGDVRFRQALSLAINREEINEVVFFGLGTPRQATVIPSCSFYKEEWATSFAEYDPERASALLDELGLEWDAEHKYRLRPDEEPLSLLIEYIPVEGPKGRVCELVREYWEKVGIKISVKSEHRSYYQTRLGAGLHDVGTWHTDSCTEMFCQIEPLWFYPGSIWCMYIPQWQVWFATDGKSGEEPPDEWKEYVGWFEEWNSTPPGTEEWISLAQKIWDFQMEHLYVIGTVGMPVQPIAVRNNLRNFPEEGWWGWDEDFWAPYQAGQWFFKK